MALGFRPKFSTVAGATRASLTLTFPVAGDPPDHLQSKKEFIMNRNSTIWLLTALILGFYSVYVFSSARGDSPWPVVSGVVLVVGSIVSLAMSLRAKRSSGS